jgi:hypothetical protein
VLQVLARVFGRDADELAGVGGERHPVLHPDRGGDEALTVGGNAARPAGPAPGRVSREVVASQVFPVVWMW